MKTTGLCTVILMLPIGGQVLLGCAHQHPAASARDLFDSIQLGMPCSEVEARLGQAVVRYSAVSLLPASVPVLSAGAKQVEILDTEILATEILDTKTAPYFEDAAVARPIADVTAELVANGTETRLRVTVAAIGRGVAPLPGLEGTPGANLRTAEELERLLREDTLHLVARRDGRSERGATTTIDWAKVPVRRVGPDGFVDFAATTLQEWPVRVVFDGPSLGSSSDRDTWCYLEAEGAPRLAIHIRGDRIAAIESRGAKGEVR